MGLLAEIVCSGARGSIEEFWVQPPLKQALSKARLCLIVNIGPITTFTYIIGPITPYTEHIGLIYRNELWSIGIGRKSPGCNKFILVSYWVWKVKLALLHPSLAKYALLHPIKSILGLYFVLLSKTARKVTASSYPSATLVI